MRITPFLAVWLAAVTAAASPAAHHGHHKRHHHHADAETNANANADAHIARHHQRHHLRRDDDEVASDDDHPRPDLSLDHVTDDDDAHDDAHVARPPREAALDAAPADDVAIHAAPRRAERAPQFYVRAGYAYMIPQFSAGGFQLVPSPVASIAVTGPIQGGVTTPAAGTIAAIIGFAPRALGGHVAFETLVGAPAKTEFQATGALATQSLAPTALGIPTGIPALGSQLGEASAVPPMLTVLFRLPALGPFTAYAGGGASVLFVTDATITNPVLTQVGHPTFSIPPALGVIAQAGVDARLYKHWYARFDFKEIWYQPVEATISNITVHTTIPLLETVDVGTVKSQVAANPIVLQAGIGADF